MLRPGTLRFAAYARVQRLSVNAAVPTARAWFSGQPSADSDNNYPTPPETKLAFSSTVYGKDPGTARVLSPSQAAETEQLKQSVCAPASTNVPASKSNNPRAMYDSSLAQQADDGKAYSDINREVAADTPDATRVAFRSFEYGKDPIATAELSEQEAAEVAKLQSQVGHSVGSGSIPAAPLHDDRNMFDSDLTQSAGNIPTAESIKRNVEAGTPDMTRVAFRASVYGKDPQAAAELSPDQQAELEALRAMAPMTAMAAAPVHNDRNMFDSDLIEGVASVPSPESIKREVATDTPEITRLVFGNSDYGKDPQSMARSVEEQAQMDAMAETTAQAETVATAEAAPIHHERSLFDSDLTHSSGNTMDLDAIKRKVVADTPEATRLVFGGSDYGKDPTSMARTTEQQRKIETLAARAVAEKINRQNMAPIHHNRSLFDSDLTHGAGSVRESDAIKRDVAPNTPELTRLSFFGSTCK